MNVVTQRDLIKSITVRYDRAYGNGNYGAHKLVVLGMLKQLNLDTCSPRDVAQIIGTYAWTRLVCDQCEKDTDWVLILGGGMDFGQPSFRICKKCAAKAGRLAE